MSAETLRLRDEQDGEHDVALSPGRATIAGVELIVEPDEDRSVRLRRLAADGTTVPTVTAYVATSGDTHWVFLDGEVFRFTPASSTRRKRTATAGGSLVAPMPATVRRVEAHPGQAVRRGDILIVLEAMKMELPVRAPADGTVVRVICREGELVPSGQELVELTP